MNDEFSKVFDVTKPSGVNPSNTSRPIIVGHHPTMPDPMMRPPTPTLEPASPPPVPPPALSAASPGVTQPPSHTLTQPSPRTETPTIPDHHQTKVISVSDAVRSEIAASEPKLPAEPHPETPAPTSLSSPEPVSSIVGPSSAPAPDVPAAGFVSSATSPGGNVVTPTAVPNMATPTAQTASAEVHHQSLPMGDAPSTGARRLKHFVLWLFIIVFLAAFAGYLAIDAGFVSTSLKLPFHIFDRQI